MDFRIIVLLSMAIFVSCSSGSPLHDSMKGDEPAGQNMPQKRESKSAVEEWTEEGVVHQEEIQVDVDKQTEKIHVEASEGSEEATFLLDYNQNLLMVKIGDRCGLLTVPPGFGEPPNELAQDLENQEKEQGSPAQTSTFNLQDGSELSDADRDSLSQDMQDLCDGIKIFNTEIVGDDVIASKRNGKRACEVKVVSGCIPFWPFCFSWHETHCY